MLVHFSMKDVALQQSSNHSIVLNSLHSFIGLFLSTVVTGGPLGSVVGNISEEYLGDEELLLEAFEFLHTFFFQVGILFFVVAGVCVGAVLEEVNQLEEISALALDADG